MKHNCPGDDCKYCARRIDRAEDDRDYGDRFEDEQLDWVDDWRAS